MRTNPIFGNDLKYKNDSPNSNFHSNSTSKIVILNAAVSNKIASKHFSLNKTNEQNNVNRN